MKIFNTRDELIAALPKNLIVAELGVFQGQFADLIHKHMEPKELWLVDMWEKGPFGSGDKDGKNHTVIDDMENVYFELKEKYKKQSNINLYRGTTTQFLKKFAENSFDMIYIDADHSFDGVFNDLTLSFKCIRNTGILAGHDYVYGTPAAAAVNTFCSRYNQSLRAITRDGCPSFLIQVQK